MQQVTLGNSFTHDSFQIERRQSHKFAVCQENLKKSYQLLKDNISSLTLREFHRDPKTSHIRIISSLGIRYFKPDVVREILDDESGDLKGVKGSYPISARGLCFFQNPSNPFLEYIMNSLFYHLNNEFSVASEICHFEVDGEKSYSVLISKDIHHTSLEQSVENLTLNKDEWKRWTWLLISLILIKPSDGIASRYGFDGENRIFCVDGSILVDNFERMFFDESKFCSILFCYFQDRNLDSEALHEFCNLNPDEVLANWIDDVSQKESEYSSSSIKGINFNLFKPGVLAALNYQFCFLQDEIAKVVQRHESMTAIDLLKKMVDFSRGYPETSTGNQLSALYLSSAGETIQAKFHSIVTKSFTSILKDQAYAIVGRLTSDPTQFLPALTIKNELYCNLEKATLSLQSETVLSEESKIGGNFQEIQSREVQKILLHLLSYKFSLREKKPISISIQYCTALDITFLLPFLHQNLEYLDLRFCHGLQSRDLITIRNRCPKLKELDISGCLGLKIIQDHHRHLSFPHLTFICFDHCKNLETIKLCSPCLDIIMGNANLKLSIVNILTLRVPERQFINCPNVNSESLEAELSEISREKKERFCKEFQAQKEFMIEIARQHNLLAQEVCDSLKGDSEFMLELIKNNRFGLTFASEELKNKSAFMLEAIKINPDYFEFAAESLKNDKNFAIQALRINGSLLKYMNHFRNDREIVLEAVMNDNSGVDLDNECLLVLQNDESVLFFASDELKNDKNLVLAAINKNKAAYNYASEELKKDKEIQLAAGINCYN